MQQNAKDKFFSRNVLFAFARRKYFIRLIKPYVDYGYYLERNPDVRSANIDPARHYLEYGWREGRNPNLSFDSKFYIERHMAPHGKVYCPLIHYAREGKRHSLLTMMDSQASFFSQTLGTDILHVIDHFFDTSVLRQPVLSNVQNRRVLKWMFSPVYYRQMKNLPDISDNEALARYLAFDLESGMSPGPLFDNDYYVKAAAESGERLNSSVPFLHWLEHGLPKRVSPTPLYSDEEYVTLNRDLAHPVPWPGWPFLHLLEHGLREGRRINRNFSLPRHATSGLRRFPQPPLADFVDMAARRPKVYDDIRAINEFHNSKLFKQLVHAALAIEPGIGSVGENIPSHIPSVGEPAFLDFQEILALIPEGEFHSIICMPFCKMGGADFIAGCLAHALQDSGRVLILRTDQSEWSCPQWFPEGIVTVDLSSHLEVVERQLRTRILYELVRKIAPRNVFNVNSRLCFDTFVRYGRRISVFTNAYAYYFCSDRTEDGVEVGYPVWYFGQIIENLHGAFIDNAALANTLKDRFLLPEDIAAKVKVAYTPMMGHRREKAAAEMQVATSSLRQSPVLLWAGRFDRQKRFDLLVEIARELPDVTFKGWGKAVLDAPPDLSTIPDNLHIFPPFKSHDELPLDQSDGWLYTSEWDGLPTILIECGGLGLPIVASDVGGVGELIDEETGWPVRDANTVQSYVDAIKDMLDKPDERLRRAENLRRVVATRHTMEAYRQTIRSAMEAVGAEDGL